LREQPLLGYSGDSPMLEPAHWNGVRFLLHECTFLEPESARRAHANLPQVVAAAAALPLEALILLHFSARYSTAEIAQAVVREAETRRPTFPIFVVPPGEVVRDVLATRPVWSPSARSA
jgi:ribonuclease Z